MIYKLKEHVTEQDLLDIGYSKALGDYTYWYMKPCKGRKILIRKYDKHINFPDIEDIQDLIDLDYVEVVE